MANKNDLAKMRTDWAEDRTILANERTFAGWMRTGMAAIVVALALRALFEPFEPSWLPKVVSTTFVVVAIAIFWVAKESCAPAQRDLDDHATNAQSAWRMKAISWSLTLASVATGAILWFV